MMKGKDSNFILNAKGKGEPVESLKKRCGVVALALFKQKASITELGTLKASQLVRGDSIKSGVAIVES